MTLRLAGGYNPSMFGVSFSKILLLVLVVTAVYFGFKYLAGGNAPSKERVRAKAGEDDAPAVEDMVRCPACGTYQARGTGRCERADCPTRG